MRINLSNLLLQMRKSGRPLPIGSLAKKSRVLMIQSDGLHSMLVHSNHATLMSPSHHCFHDSKYVAMVRHSMDVVQRAVRLLNPGQVPVLTLDQPLFTIAKQIQWNWPDVYVEDNFVILLGGLPIEMAALTTL